MGLGRVTAAALRGLRLILVALALRSLDIRITPRMRTGVLYR